MSLAYACPSSAGHRSHDVAPIMTKLLMLSEIDKAIIGIKVYHRIVGDREMLEVMGDGFRLRGLVQGIHYRPPNTLKHLISNGSTIERLDCRFV